MEHIIDRNMIFRRENLNIVPLWFFGILFVSIGLEVFFGIMYYDKGIEAFYWPHYIAFSLALEFIILHTVPIVSALVLFLIAQKKDFYNLWWFRQRRFESRLYKSLNIKNWKARVLTYDKNLFDLNKLSPRAVLISITQSEIVHEANIILSYLPMIFADRLGHPWVLFILCSFGSVGHIPFIVIQRYNRPRIVRLMKKMSDKK